MFSAEISLELMPTAALILAASIAVGGHPAHRTVDVHKGKKPDLLSIIIDKSVDPGVDFFSYSNGLWIKAYPIPPSESSWGIGNAVITELRSKLLTVNQHASKNAKPGSDDQKVHDFWTTGNDEAKAERLGITPLRPLFDRIDAISTVQDAVDVSFWIQNQGVSSLFSFYVGQDEKSSDVMAVHVQQGGLGLPERDFYFNSEAGVAKIRAEYLKHLEILLKLAGDSDETATAKATSIMNFETSLAKASRKLEDLRDPIANYHKMTPDDVTSKLTPSIDWQKHLSDWNLNPSAVVVGQPEFLSSLEALLKGTSIDLLKSYFRVRTLAAYSPYLNKSAVDEDFRFNHTVLSGQKTLKPRWKRVIDSEGEAIGFILGRIFVRDYFPPASKKRYADIVEAFRQAYGRRIDKLDWMSPATKAKAHLKLSMLHKKVGYPDKWKDYSKLEIGTESYCQNMINASKWAFEDMLSKFGKPVDRNEWDMTPQTYNAYYNPSNNEIVLPAASFAVPGLLDSEVDEAFAYGYAGASTIGHEMTHGFDDEGRQYDGKGNLSEWWTKDDAKKFQNRAAVMIKQFNSYQPLPGLHINGKASLGENIADYGGILLGIDAFKRTASYKSGKKIGGLTPIQRFFLGYAISWMTEERPEVLRRQLLSDVHAPAKWRVLGPLSNIPEFYKAFHIKPGQPMWRPENQRVRIW